MWNYHSLTEVAEMHEGVEKGENKDDPSHHLVKVHVLVQWQKRTRSVCAQERDGLP